MKPRGSGAIVLTASTNSFDGEANLVAYNASKAGLLGLLHTAANELGPHGIRVNAVCPGLIRTPLSRRQFDDPGFLRGYFQHIPLGRGGEPEEVAGAILFLASEAAAYITGATLLVDGGQSAGKFGTWDERRGRVRRGPLAASLIRSRRQRRRVGQQWRGVVRRARAAPGPSPAAPGCADRWFPGHRPRRHARPGSAWCWRRARRFGPGRGAGARSALDGGCSRRPGWWGRRWRRRCSTACCCAGGHARSSSRGATWPPASPRRATGSPPGSSPAAACTGRISPPWRSGLVFLALGVAHADRLPGAAPQADPLRRRRGDPRRQRGGGAEQRRAGDRAGDHHRSRGRGELRRLGGTRCAGTGWPCCWRWRCTRCASCWSARVILGLPARLAGAPLDQEIAEKRNTAVGAVEGLAYVAIALLVTGDRFDRRAAPADRLRRAGRARWCRPGWSPIPGWTDSRASPPRPLPLPAAAGRGRWPRGRAGGGRLPRGGPAGRAGRAGAARRLLRPHPGAEAAVAELGAAVARDGPRRRVPGRRTGGAHDRWSAS